MSTTHMHTNKDLKIHGKIALLNLGDKIGSVREENNDNKMLNKNGMLLKNLLGPAR